MCHSFNNLSYQTTQKCINIKGVPLKKKYKRTRLHKNTRIKYKSNNRTKIQIELNTCIKLHKEKLFIK